MRALMWVGLVGCSSMVLGGCPGGVEGQVDGQDVPAMLSAFFIQLDEADKAYGVSAGMASVPGGCDAATQRQENLNDATETHIDDLKKAEGDAKKVEDADDAFADALVEWEVQNVPTDYWTVGVSVNVEDDGDVQDKFDIEDDAGKVGVSICRVNDHPINRNHRFHADQDCYVAIKGDVDISTFKEGEAFVFSADVKLAEAQDTERKSGDVVITGSASSCESLESAVDDYAEILADAAGGG